MRQVKSHAEEIKAASHVLLCDINHNLSVVSMKLILLSFVPIKMQGVFSTSAFSGFL